MYVCASVCLPDSLYLCTTFLWSVCVLVVFVVMCVCGGARQTEVLLGEGRGGDTLQVDSPRGGAVGGRGCVGGWGIARV